MTNKKDFFSIPEEIYYLNCAAMSPTPKVAEIAGIEGLLRKSQPQEIITTDFFENAEKVRELFAKLINCPTSENIAIMPSVSYGVALVVKNILKKQIPISKTKVILIGDEFPSDVYGWHELISERPKLKIETISAPETLENRGQKWNKKLVEALDKDVLLICLSPTHWADGTSFNLENISKKCKENNILLIIDGTQHIGAMEFDVEKIKPDFVICATYKWLLGPYGSALAYLGEYFNDGYPLEQTWIGRKNSNDFKNLINYQSEYQDGAFRYNMGEFSNFITLPMVQKSLELLIEWQPDNIQQYTKNLSQKYVEKLKSLGFWIEEEEFRASHMFGIRIPSNISIEAIQKAMLENKVFVSYRGNAIRISINVWNTKKDLEHFCKILENLTK